MQEYVLADRLKNQFHSRIDECAARASSMKKVNGGFTDTAVFTNSYARTAVNNTRGNNDLRGNNNTRGRRRNIAASKAENPIGRLFDSFRSPAKKLAGGVAVPSVEIKVPKKSVSPMFLLMLLVSTILIMFLVMSISEVYKATNTLSRMEYELTTLENEAGKLRLALDEKNDIRTIETIAKSELGMTKEDSLQRRYVSLSDGEHIDVLEVPEDDNNSGGMLLSSFFASLAGLFDGSN